MKVKELIQHLKGIDQEATVIIPNSNFEQGHVDIECKYIWESHTGLKKKEHFTDAFDYTSYTKETWSANGGKEAIVKIS